jgi:hypothetical protein
MHGASSRLRTRSWSRPWTSRGDERRARERERGAARAHRGGLARERTPRLGPLQQRPGRDRRRRGAAGGRRARGRRFGRGLQRRDRPAGNVSVWDGRRPSILPYGRTRGRRGRRKRASQADLLLLRGLRQLSQSRGVPGPGPAAAPKPRDVRARARLRRQPPRSGRSFPGGDGAHDRRGRSAPGQVPHRRAQGLPRSRGVAATMAALSTRGDALRRRASDARREAAELRGATEAAVRESRRRRHECLLDDARARRMRAQPVCSAWSDLRWRRPEADLHQVLVPVPEER